MDKDIELVDDLIQKNLQGLFRTEAEYLYMIINLSQTIGNARSDVTAKSVYKQVLKSLYSKANVDKFISLVSSNVSDSARRDYEKYKSELEQAIIKSSDVLRKNLVDRFDSLSQQLRLSNENSFNVINSKLAEIVTKYDNLFTTVKVNSNRFAEYDQLLSGIVSDYNKEQIIMTQKLTSLDDKLNALNTVVSTLPKTLTQDEINAIITEEITRSIATLHVEDVLRKSDLNTVYSNLDNGLALMKKTLEDEIAEKERLINERIKEIDVDVSKQLPKFDDVNKVIEDMSSYQSQLKIMRTLATMAISQLKYAEELAMKAFVIIDRPVIQRLDTPFMSNILTLLIFPDDVCIVNKQGSDIERTFRYKLVQMKVTKGNSVLTFSVENSVLRIDDKSFDLTNAACASVTLSSQKKDSAAYYGNYYYNVIDVALYKFESGVVVIDKPSSRTMSKYENKFNWKAESNYAIVSDLTATGSDVLILNTGSPDAYWYGQKVIQDVAVFESAYINTAIQIGAHKFYACSVVNCYYASNYLNETYDIGTEDTTDFLALIQTVYRTQEQLRNLINNTVVYKTFENIVYTPAKLDWNVIQSTANTIPVRDQAIYSGSEMTRNTVSKGTLTISFDSKNGLSMLKQQRTTTVPMLAPDSSEMNVDINISVIAEPSYVYGMNHQDSYQLVAESSEQKFVTRDQKTGFGNGFTDYLFDVAIEKYDNYLSYQMRSFTVVIDVGRSQLQSQVSLNVDELNIGKLATTDQEFDIILKRNDGVSTQVTDATGVYYTTRYILNFTSNVTLNLSTFKSTLWGRPQIATRRREYTQHMEQIIDNVGTMVSHMTDKEEPSYKLTIEAYSDGHVVNVTDFFVQIEKMTFTHSGFANFNTFAAPSSAMVSVTFNELPAGVLSVRTPTIPVSADALAVDSSALRLIYQRLADYEVSITSLQIQANQLQASFNELVNQISEMESRSLSPLGWATQIVNLVATVTSFINPLVGGVLFAVDGVLSFALSVESGSPDAFLGAMTQLAGTIGTVITLSHGNFNIKPENISKIKTSLLDEISTLHNSSKEPGFVMDVPKIVNALRKLNVLEKLKNNFNGYKKFKDEETANAAANSPKWDPCDRAYITYTKMSDDFAQPFNGPVTQAVLVKNGPLAAALKAMSVAPAHAQLVLERKNVVYSGENPEFLETRYTIFGVTDFVTLRYSRIEADPDPPVVVNPKKGAVNDRITPYSITITTRTSTDGQVNIMPCEVEGLTDETLGGLILEYAKAGLDDPFLDRLTAELKTMSFNNKWIMFAQSILESKVHSVQTKARAGVPILDNSVDALIDSIFTSTKSRVPYSLYYQNCQHMAKELADLYTKCKKPKFMTDDEFKEMMDAFAENSVQ